MRPVDRPPAARAYRKYRDAIPDLEQCFGKYCSYCERYLPISLEVEHKLPKKHFKHLELEWTNFLLACKTCNSIKNDNYHANEHMLWPDRHNTVLALAYTRDVLVQPVRNLDPEVLSRASNLVKLVGLDRYEKTATKRDERWMQREAVWRYATRLSERFESHGMPKDWLEVIVETALYRGFFSVWLTVFRDHPNVKQCLISAFPGTARSCFKDDGTPTPRPNAVI